MKKSFKAGELTEAEINELLSERRIKVLAKYINKHYLKDGSMWDDRHGVDLTLIIHLEIIKGLNDEFEFLRDDPRDPKIIHLIHVKTEKILEELKKKNEKINPN